MLPAGDGTSRAPGRESSGYGRLASSSLDNFSTNWLRGEWQTVLLNLLEMKPRARNPATNRAAPVAMAECEMPRSSKDHAEVHEAITKQIFNVLYRWRSLARI